MGNLNPTPTELVTALKANGVKVALTDGWATRGREWAGPDGSDGLLGVVVHHTSTPSATGDKGAPSLGWCIEATSRGACNILVGREGIAHVITAGSAFHTGNGGPWRAIGIDSPGNRAHYRLFGIEIDDPGTGRTITVEQQEAVGRICAALKALCGWGEDRIIRHADWTDFGPFRGRKTDTLEQFYPTQLWRDLARKYAPKPASGQAAGLHVVRTGGRSPLARAEVVRQAGMSTERFNRFNPNCPDPVPAGTPVRVPLSVTAIYPGRDRAPKQT